MRQLHFILVALVLSAFALLVGCGGNSTEDPLGNTPTAFTVPIVLGGSDTAELSINIDETNATGSLEHVAPPGRATRSIPVGNYPLAGTFTFPNSFSLSGELGDGTPILVTGHTPTEDSPGDYELTVGTDTTEGGILPASAPTPGVSIAPTTLGMEPGQGSNLEAEAVNFPLGTIEYRWFIAAPSAYFSTLTTPAQTGQDITVTQDRVRIQTSFADEGVLRAYVHAFHKDANGLRTFLGEAVCLVELTDIQFLEPTWVHEAGTNPASGDVYDSYFWEFPIVAGANRYLISSYNHNTGAETMRHRLLQVDINNSPPTAVPIYFGFQPSFPPVVPVSEEISGVVRYNCIRRGNSIRIHIVTTDPSNSELYRTLNPVSVKVYY